MTEDEAHRQAEALAQGMGITFYVVRNSEGQFLPVHVVPDDCEHSNDHATRRRAVR
jgi:hypothetical protein